MFLELIHLQNRMFHTCISSNAAETLQFEDLAVKINIVNSMCACFREKSQIVSLSTFDHVNFKKNNYFDKNVSRVRERVFFTLSRTLDIFSSKYFFLFLIHVDQKYSLKQFEIFP